MLSPVALRIASCAALLVSSVESNAQSAHDGRFTVQASSFFFARYATVSASAMYVGYSFGPVGFVAGLVESPKTTYRELIAGGYTRFGVANQGATAAVAFASASDAPYLQIYLNPSLHAGRLALSGSLEQYVPLDEQGTWELDFNPATLLIRLHRFVSVGGVYTVAMPTGGVSKQRAGPALQIDIPHGALNVEFLRNLNR